MSSRHWIGSVKFELGSKSIDALDPVRRSIRQQHEQILLKPLERALDRVDRPGRISRHRRIELNLGTIVPGEFAAALAKGIGEELFADLEWSTSPKDCGGAAHAAELLLEFLETGLLSWTSPGEALEIISSNLAAAETAELEPLLPRFRWLLAGSALASLRLARQCPLGLVLRIVVLLAGRDAGQKNLGSLIARYAREPQARRLSRMLVNLAKDEGPSEQDWHWLEGMMDGDSAAGPALTTGTTRPTHPAPAEVVGAHDAEPSTPSSEPELEHLDRVAEEVAPEAGYPLEGAGLVLLHPFVAGLMGACGLLDGDGAFKGQTEGEKGILLLNLAATGSCEAPEPELLLAKLLLGLDIDAGAPRSIDPTPSELLEVEAMLKAAIAHWGVLGETSPDALREAFLVRPGRLSRKDNDWRLIVEPRGVDVLIDRLPWPVGLVLTPFMTRPLRVEWR